MRETAISKNRGTTPIGHGCSLMRPVDRVIRLWLSEDEDADDHNMGHRSVRRNCVIDLCIELSLPADVVWDFLADIQDAEPIPRRALVRMSKIPPGPTSVGTRWRESVRFAPGLWMPVDSVVTQAVRPRLLAMTFHSRWWSGDLRYEITRTGPGCLLRHRETLTPCPVLRPATKWIERSLRAHIEERLHDIHDVLISRAP